MRILMVITAALLSVGLLSVGLPTSARAIGPVSPTAPTMIILDGSGSMLAHDAPGSRIDAAKHAVQGLVAALPSGARLGLEVYGTATSSAGSAKAAGCRDIRTLVPVGPVDKASFTSTVAGVRARGYTPIGNALRQAAAALPAEGSRSIVLVSDGEDTCAPPAPCDVARELHAQGVDLAIHTVGFKVDARARAQLQCIADATGGSYVDAPDGASLAEKLPAQVQRALRGYQVSGTAVAGSDNPADAPELRAGGQYVDSFHDVDEAKYYAITLRTGDTPYLSATIVPRDGVTSARPVGSLQVQSQLESLDGRCTSGYGNGYDFVLGRAVRAATAVSRPGQVGTDKTCLTAGPAVVKVTRSGTAYRGLPLQVELALRAEPPADTSGLTPAAEAQDYVAPTVTGRATPIDSGSSFNSAPLLTTGVYRDSFVTGENRYVRVHVDWGQTLSYTITPTRLPGHGYGFSVYGFSSIANPLRESLNSPPGSNTSQPFPGSTDTSLTNSTPAPVHYLNRFSTSSTVAECSLAGDYYIVLSTGVPASGAPFADPYVLRISVSGTAQAGPRYLPPGTSVPPGTTSPTSTPTTTPGSGAPSTDSSGAPTFGGDPSAVAGSSSADGGGISSAAVLGIGGGVLLAGLGLGWWLLRRRGQHGASGTRVLPTNEW